MTDLKVERDCIDGDDMLACKVLQSAGEKRLWEEETGDPEYLQQTHKNITFTMS